MTHAFAAGDAALDLVARAPFAYGEEAASDGEAGLPLLPAAMQQAIAATTTTAKA